VKLRITHEKLEDLHPQTSRNYGTSVRGGAAGIIASLDEETAAAVLANWTSG